MLKPHKASFTLLLCNMKPCLGNFSSHFTKRIQKDIPSWGLEDHVSPSLLLFLLAFHCKLGLDHPFWLIWGCFHCFPSLPSCQFTMVGAKKGTWKLNQVYILSPPQVHRAMRQCLFHYLGHWALTSTDSIMKVIYQGLPPNAGSGCALCPFWKGQPDHLLFLNPPLTQTFLLPIALRQTNFAESTF